MTYIGAIEMAQIVAPIFGLKPCDVLERGRKKPRVHARAAVIRALRDRGLSPNQIARLVRHKDKTTIHNALTKFDDYAMADDRVSFAYAQIKQAEARA